MAREPWHKYHPSVIRGALVSHWLNANGYADYHLEDLRLPQNLFSTLEPADSSLSDTIKATFPALSLKQLETAFETLVGSDDKRRSGVVLTPSFIVDYLTTTAVTFFSQASHDVPSVCDPACGYAGFLVPALELLNTVYSVQPSEAATNYIYGYDINPHAVAIARVILALSVLNLGQDPKGLDFNLHCRDTLLVDTGDFEPSDRQLPVFDVLVSNPPYIKLQNLPLDYRARLEGRYPEYSIGSYSTAMLFLIAGHRLLSPGGCLGYITQNNLFTSLAGRQVRKFLAETECIRRIIDFGPSNVFGHASAYTCLLFLTSGKTESFEYAKLVKGVSSSGLARLQYSTVSHSSLSPSKWRLVPRKHQDNITKLETTGTPLGVLSTIRVGFATLKDRAYLVRASGDSILAMSADGHEYGIEPEVTRPAIKVADFDAQAELAANTRRIVFPYERVNGNHRPLPEHVLAREFPRCYAHLMSWKGDLAARDKGLRAIEPWYAWGRAQSMDAPGPKLLTKTFSDRPNFMLDESDSLFCNGYGVFPKPSVATLFMPAYPLTVIQAILNSAIMDYYLRLTSFQIEGDYQCYQKNFIERLSIPVLDHEEVRLLPDLQGAERDGFLCQKYRLDYAAVSDLLAERA